MLSLIHISMDDGSIYDFVVVGVYKYNAALFGKVDTSVREKDRSTYMMIPIQTSFKLQGADKTGYEYFNLLLTPLADEMCIRDSHRSARRRFSTGR